MDSCEAFDATFKILNMTNIVIGRLATLQKYGVDECPTQGQRALNRQSTTLDRLCLESKVRWSSQLNDSFVKILIANIYDESKADKPKIIAVFDGGVMCRVNNTIMPQINGSNMLKNLSCGDDKTPSVFALELKAILDAETSQTQTLRFVHNGEGMLSPFHSFTITTAAHTTTSGILYKNQIKDVLDKLFGKKTTATGGSIPKVHVMGRDRKVLKIRVEGNRSIRMVRYKNRMVLLSQLRQLEKALKAKPTKNK